MEFVNKVTSWEFLNEPLWRWFVFIVALTLMLMVWSAVLSFMR